MAMSRPMKRSDLSDDRAGVDDALMQRYAAGDVAAFDELYEHYEAPIYGFCLRYLSDADSAADALQEVFVRLIDARTSYQPRGRFRSWVFTITRRVCVDRSRERMHEPLEAGGRDTHVGRSFVDDIEHRDEVERVLSVLTPEQREVLLLHRYYGFSYGEISEMVGATEAAVKQKAYRALLDLRNGRRSTP